MAYLEEDFTLAGRASLQVVAESIVKLLGKDTEEGKKAAEEMKNLLTPETPDSGEMKNSLNPEPEKTTTMKNSVGPTTGPRR